MTNEQIFFINILRDHINRNKTKIPDDIDWNVIRNYAIKHQVEGIVYRQTKTPMLETEYDSTVLRGVNRKNILDRFIKEIGDKEYFLLKGAEIAKLYPIPFLRSMGDVDIVVHSDDREYVHKKLIDFGFSSITKHSTREWQYSLNGFDFELHDRLIYEENVNLDKQEAFFNGFWEYVSNNTLDMNFHFLFMISHLRKHLMNSGAGFRYFMDIAIVTDGANLNWKWIEQKADEIEMLPFLKNVLAFCNRWFGTSVPIEIADLDSEFYESATEKIFKDGIFGFDNDENKTALAVNTYVAKGKNENIRRIIRTVFPSYKSMCGISRYKFLVGKPYLLPIAWLMRLLKKDKKLTAKDVKNLYAKNGEISSRTESYSKWGL